MGTCLLGGVYVYLYKCFNCNFSQCLKKYTPQKWFLMKIKFSPHCAFLSLFILLLRGNYWYFNRASYFSNLIHDQITFSL